MEHSKQDLDYLIDKYLSGAATDQERNLLEQSYMKASTRMLKNDKLDSHAARIDEIGVKSWEHLMEKIDGERTRRSYLWPRVLAVAAAVATVVLGIYFFNNNQGKSVNDTNAVTQDIAPGRVGATLTLANGKKIKLTNAANGELAKEAGVMITKSEDGQIIYEIQNSAAEANKINTLTTAKGETYRLRLPDGSLVWLNAASSLTYSASLIERGKRMVRLRGEGYFEVFKDKAHPFVVKVQKSDKLPEQEITVLGTHFNVKAYGDEDNIKTTLLEGSVRIATPGSSLQREGKTGQFPGHIVLKPNEQSIVASGKQIKVNQADIEEAIAWKNGDFSFKDERIQTIMQSISRWYNVEVRYEGNITEDGFNGKISRFKNINQILKMLEDTKLVHFKVEGRRVIVRE